VREVLNFTMRVAAADQALESWREGLHDHVGLTAAIAAWLEERGTRRLRIYPQGGRGTAKCCRGALRKGHATAHVRRV
jgi:hypothetical protein